MPVDFERKLVKIGNSYRITIPPEIIEALKLKPGEMMRINTTDSKIIMEKKK